MGKITKKQLLEEAEKQTKILKGLKVWLRNSISLSTIAMVIAYFGIRRSGVSFTFGLIGVIMAVLCIISAFLINLGIRNGKQNVEKILCRVDRM